MSLVNIQAKDGAAGVALQGPKLPSMFEGHNVGSNGRLQQRSGWEWASTLTSAQDRLDTRMTRAEAKHAAAAKKADGKKADGKKDDVKKDDEAEEGCSWTSPFTMVGNMFLTVFNGVLELFKSIFSICSYSDNAEVAKPADDKGKVAPDKKDEGAPVAKKDDSKEAAKA